MLRETRSDQSGLGFDRQCRVHACNPSIWLVSLLAILLTSPSLSWGMVNPNDWAECQNYLLKMSSSWAAEAQNTMSQLMGRQLMPLRQTQLVGSALERTLGLDKGLTSHVVEISLGHAGDQLALIFTSVRDQSQAIVPLGPGELVSHAGARKLSCMAGECSPFFRYARVLFPILASPAQGVLASSFVVQVAMDEVSGLERVWIKSRQVADVADAAEYPETWYNMRGQVIYLSPGATFAVERKVGDRPWLR